MKLQLLHSIVLLLGSSTVLQALTIPVANPDALASHGEVSRDGLDILNVERRYPKGGGKGGSKPPTKPSKSSSSPPPPPVTSKPSAPPPASSSAPPPPPPSSSKISSVPLSSQTSSTIISFSSQEAPTPSVVTSPFTSPVPSTSSDPGVSSFSATSFSSASSSPSTTSSGSTSGITSAAHSSTSSGSASLSASVVKPSPFTWSPESTGAFDVCKLPGFECLADGEPDYDSTASTVPEGTEPAHNSTQLTKRAQNGDRIYTVNFPGNTLVLGSKKYFSAGDLYVKRPALTKVIADYATSNDRRHVVKIFGAYPSGRPATNANGRYATEHIVELQTIQKFIYAVTGTKPPTGKNLVQMSTKVDPTWFYKWMAKDVTARIAARPHVWQGYNPITEPDKSLSNLLFEALGSQDNVEDFAICELGINSFKAKLWSGTNPVVTKDWQKMATEAADGSIPASEHLSELRTAMAVYDYMMKPEIVSRMQRAIANVKTELTKANILALTQGPNTPNGDEPKDTTGKVVDLSELWIEYMDKHLERFKSDGKKWIDDQIKHALPLYKAELQRLEKADMDLKNEKKIANLQARLAAENTRNNAANQLIASYNQLDAALTTADNNLKTAEATYNAAKAQVNAVVPAAKAAEKKKTGYQKKQTAWTKAKKAYWAAFISRNREGRKIIVLRPDYLPKYLKQARADFAQLRNFQKVLPSLDVPSAE